LLKIYSISLSSSHHYSTSILTVRVNRHSIINKIVTRIKSDRYTIWSKNIKHIFCNVHH
ncbi:hypothetical protein GIB67_016124, partial [Kingdonia uniflora]